MAEPTSQDIDAEIAAIRAELERRGAPVPQQQAATPAAQPAAPATPQQVMVPSYDLQGNVTGEIPVEAQAPASDPVGAAVKDLVRGIAVEGPGAIVRGFGAAVQETGNVVRD